MKIEHDGTTFVQNDSGRYAYHCLSNGDWAGFFYEPNQTRWIEVLRQKSEAEIIKALEAQGMIVDDGAATAAYESAEAAYLAEEGGGA